MKVRKYPAKNCAPSYQHGMLSLTQRLQNCALMELDAKEMPNSITSH